MAQAEEIRTETGPLDYDYTEKEVELCQENLQNHKACSPDKIKNEMLNVTELQQIVNVVATFVEDYRLEINLKPGKTEVGDEVLRNDSVFEVDTELAVIAIHSSEHGWMAKQLFKVGDLVHPGQSVAVFYRHKEDLQPSPPPPPEKKEGAVETAAAPAGQPTAGAAGPSEAESAKPTGPAQGGSTPTQQ
eukprot:g73993.t1